MRVCACVFVIADREVERESKAGEARAALKPAEGVFLPCSRPLLHPSVSPFPGRGGRGTVPRLRGTVQTRPERASSHPQAPLPSSRLLFISHFCFLMWAVAASALTPLFSSSRFFFSSFSLSSSSLFTFIFDLRHFAPLVPPLSPLSVPSLHYHGHDLHRRTAASR